MEELDEDWLYALLDDLERDLAALWTAEKAAIDADVRGRLGLPADAVLQPWHYADPFFQDPPPPADDPLLDAVAGVDALRHRAARTSRRSGTTSTPSSRAPTSSPRPGKDQHAFQLTVVRGSDIRTLCNLEPTLRWLETLLHELGHAIYDDSVDKSLPWLLRTHSHTFTTEAVAMLHGRRARDHVFLERFAGIAPDVARHPANTAVARRDLLVFAAWVQVMARFERSLYADPGQDLVATWWNPVERYQRLQRPDGHRPRRLGRQDPPHRRAGLLPQLPARPDDGLAARGDAGAGARQPQPGGRTRRRR